MHVAGLSMVDQNDVSSFTCTSLAPQVMSTVGSGNEDDALSINVCSGRCGVGCALLGTCRKMHSSLWGFNNGQYTEMTAQTQSELQDLVQEFRRRTPRPINRYG